MECVFLEYPSTEDLAKLPLAIEELNIKGLGFIDNLPLLPNLKKITMRGSVSKEEIPQLFGFLSQLPHLSELQLVGFDDVLNDEDWKYLSLVPHLQSVVLEFCTSDEYCHLTEDALSHFHRLSNLKKVKIYYSFLLTDVALEHLAKCKLLEEIDLQCGNFGDKGLRAISRLTKLKKLVLDGCGKATDKGFKSLLALSSYEEIDLRECRNLRLPTLSQISQASHLLHLKIERIRKLGKGHLVFPQLKSLTLNFCGLKECSFTLPSSLEHLIIRSILSQEQLLSLAAAINLQTLSLRLFTLDSKTVEGLQFFKHLKKLHTLNLSRSCFKSTHELAILKELPQLENLDLSHTHDLDDTALSIISTLDHLKCLCLHDCQGFTSDGLKQLSKLKNLRELNLNWCSGISEETFTEFSPLDKLEKLHLRSHEANEKVLRSLQVFPSLKILYIIKNRIDAEKLQNIVDEHPTLQRVEIERFPSIFKEGNK